TRRIRSQLLRAAPKHAGHSHNLKPRTNPERFSLSVIMAVLPTLGNSIIAVMQGKNVSVYEIAVRGDLYVVCMGLTATAIGQAVLRRDHPRHYLVALLTIFAILLLVGLVILSGAKDLPDVDRELLGRMSLWLFGGTVLITGVLTYLCELELPS
ncbi:hypothetical protein ACIA98_42585, partial [Streptomyces sp. NPDC051366]|uniref:hypothetical protein n=1 Tax=Streptomyces sp. NPDC051366 TaxID=3365652 RepID=UPI0037ADC850